MLQTQKSCKPKVILTDFSKNLKDTKSDKKMTTLCIFYERKWGWGWVFKALNFSKKITFFLIL